MGFTRAELVPLVHVIMRPHHSFNRPFLFVHAFGYHSLMERLNHPHLIRMLEMIDSPKRIHIVMEYAGG